MNWLSQLVEHWSHKDGIANAFGLILYTDAHPHIKKVLADNDYWNALDKISSSRWVIFSIRAKPGHYSYPNHRLPPGAIGMMIGVWKEPDENEYLLQEFEIKSTEKLPQLIVFAKGTNGEILSQSIRLDDFSKEKAYDSLKNAIKIISKAIDDVLPENIKSAEGVYTAIDMSVSNYKQWQLIKKGVLYLKWIKDLFT